METFREWVYLGPGKLELQTAQKEEPTGDLVRIKVKAASICGSDLMAYRSYNERMIPPLVLGHEFAGIVDAVGPEVRNVKIGQRVTANPVLACGKCFTCLDGHPNICPHRRNTGVSANGGWNGALREYTYMPADSIIPLPDELSFVQGSLIEPLGVGMHASEVGYLPSEETTVIYGGGPIGLFTLISVKSKGVKNAVLMDVLDTRLEKAKKLGADYTFNPLRGDPVDFVNQIAAERGGADRIIICANAGSVWTQALNMPRPGGTVVLVAGIRSEVTFAPKMITARAAQVMSSMTFLNSHLLEGIDLIRKGKIDVNRMISSIVPFEDTQKAFDALAAPDNQEVKIVIQF